MRDNMRKRGFTLVEMLVVIALIAILVAIAIPTVTASVNRAKAAADASNLRNYLGVANINVFNQNEISALEKLADQPIHSKYDPDAVMMLYYKLPAFLGIYFVNQETGKCYSLDYLADVAENGSTERSPEPPDKTDGYYWMIVGGTPQQVNMEDFK